jgi:hypothetical protein
MGAEAFLVGQMLRPVTPAANAWEGLSALASPFFSNKTQAGKKVVPDLPVGSLAHV